MRMLNPAKNTNLGDWTPAAYTVPQNPITDAVSTFLSGLGRLSGGDAGGNAGGGLGGGLGAFNSVYDVTGYPILGPYDRIWAAVQRQEKNQKDLEKSYFDEIEQGLRRPTSAQLSGLSLGDFSPARFDVPENPIAHINGLAAAMNPIPTPSRVNARQGNSLGAITYGGRPGLSGCGGGCGCADCGGTGMGMGELSDYLPDGMPDFLQGTVLGLPAWAVYGGGALLVYALFSRGSGYREEKRAASEAYRRRVRRARSTYGRGYQRAADAYREARGAA